MFLNAYNSMQPPPGMGGFVPQMPGGFSPPQIGPGLTNNVPMPGNPNAGMGGGGGLGGMWNGLGPLEKAYLVSQGLSGIGNWWQGRQDRKEDRRRYDEQTELERQHRAKMGSSWQAAYG